MIYVFLHFVHERKDTEAQQPKVSPYNETLSPFQCVHAFRQGGNRSVRLLLVRVELMFQRFVLGATHSL